MAGYLRIGELSRRSGVAPELLRAWERRYGLFHPDRSGGGYRLYSDADLERVRLMQRHLADGLSAAEAAARAMAGPAAAPAGTAAPHRIDQALDELNAALDDYDDTAAHAVIDRALAELTTDTLLTGVVLPYLAELGDRWERGEATVGHEHFASNLLRGRLLGLARDWDRGAGPRAVLACAPGELHDLPLVVFGIALRARGWRVTFLGADMPVDAVASTVRATSPEILVVSATIPRRLRAAAAELAELAGSVPVAIAGAGATLAIAEQASARLLGGDPISAADRLTEELTTAAS